MAPAGIGRRIEGVHAVRAALAAGRLQELTVERRRIGNLQDLIAAAEDRGVALAVVDDVTGIAESAVPQGVVATAIPIPVIDLDEAMGLTDPAALLVLDHVEDPQNLGAVARSAAATGIPVIVAGGRRSAPFGPAAFKAAAGALETVRVCVVSSIGDAVGRMGRGGVWTVGLAAAGEVSLFGLGLLAEPVAVVLGAEGMGLSRLVFERVDVRASIPMLSGESLNVSVAAALAAYEIGRVRGSLA
jgi:23S rRNA (guanosine2251-2'-O)-methyltransferase